MQRIGDKTYGEKDENTDADYYGERGRGEEFIRKEGVKA